MRQSQWPRGLRRSSAAARLSRLWVRIPPGAWMFVCCECCVLSGRGLGDEIITRPEGVLPTVVRRVWSRNLVNEEALAHWGLSRQTKTAIHLLVSKILFVAMAQQSLVGQGLLIHEVSRSHTEAPHRTLPEEWSARRRDLYLTTRHRQ